MLVLDALEGDAPQLITILGTRTATLDMEVFKRGRQEVTRAVRQRWPGAQYAYEVEFTTGYGPRSGGLRRPHWNWFWKGIPVDQVEEFAAVVIDAWCRHVDAEPAVQYVAEIDNAIGLTKYVTEHFMKASQRPPEGFAGQRFCCSRAYFGEGVSVATARSRARESLRSKRELWKALQAGHGAHDAELIARQALEESYRTVWVLTNDRGARVGATGHDPKRMVTSTSPSEWAWVFAIADTWRVPEPDLQTAPDPSPPLVRATAADSQLSMGITPVRVATPGGELAGSPSKLEAGMPTPPDPTPPRGRGLSLERH